MLHSNKCLLLFYFFKCLPFIQFLIKQQRFSNVLFQKAQFYTTNSFMAFIYCQNQTPSHCFTTASQDWPQYSGLWASYAWVSGKAATSNPSMLAPRHTAEPKYDVQTDRPCWPLCLACNFSNLGKETINNLTSTQCRGYLGKS